MVLDHKVAVNIRGKINIKVFFNLFFYSNDSQSIFFKKHFWKTNFIDIFVEFDKMIARKLFV